MNIAAVVSLNTIYIICVLYSVVYVQVASSSCLCGYCCVMSYHLSSVKFTSHWTFLSFALYLSLTLTKTISVGATS